MTERTADAARKRLDRILPYDRAATGPHRLAPRDFLTLTTDRIIGSLDWPTERMVTDVLETGFGGCRLIFEDGQVTAEPFHPWRAP